MTDRDQTEVKRGASRRGDVGEREGRRSKDVQVRGREARCAGTGRLGER